MEQIPEGRDTSEVEAEIDAKCCLCLQKWSVYRGQFSCSSKLCGVPVIVCNQCAPDANLYPNNLQCDLCRDNYRLNVAQPDLVALKRKAEQKTNTPQPLSNKKTKHHVTREKYPDRLFLSRVPLTATATKVKQLLFPGYPPSTTIDNFRVHWLTDPTTKAFYGSCMVQMPNATLAKQVMERVNKRNQNLRMDKKPVKLSYVWKKEGKEKDDDVFGGDNYKEYPPIQ